MSEAPEHRSRYQPGQWQSGEPLTGIPPPGIQVLALLDKFYIQPEEEFKNVMFDPECNNRYSIMMGDGQRILYAAENRDRCCNEYDSYRPFDINIMDYTGRVVFQMIRPCTYGLSVCGHACGNMIEMKAGDTKEYLGSVVLVNNGCQPKYDILNAEGDIVFIVLGPKCEMCCWSKYRGTLVFDILLSDGQTKVGEMIKIFDDPIIENFETMFPMDLDTRLKGVVVGAAFMIYFMHVEWKRYRGRQNPFTSCWD